MAGSELPAGGVNIQSVSGDSVIRMFYESPFFFFSSKNQSTQQRIVQAGVFYLDFTNGKMEIDVDKTFTQDLTRSALFSNLVLGRSFLDQYYSFNYPAPRKVVIQERAGQETCNSTLLIVQIWVV